MAKVYNKQFKRFMLALNKVLAGENAYHRVSKDCNEYESYTFRYYWEENHEWDGGHFNQVEYKCWYDADKRTLNIQYEFWWKVKWKEFVSSLKKALKLYKKAILQHKIDLNNEELEKIKKDFV